MHEHLDGAALGLGGFLLGWITGFVTLQDVGAAVILGAASTITGLLIKQLFNYLFNKNNNNESN